MAQIIRALTVAAVLAGTWACSQEVTGDQFAEAPVNDTIVSGDGAGSTELDVADGAPTDTSPPEDSDSLGDVPDAPETCDCQPYEYCDETDTCVDDVCQQGMTTCASPTEQKVCWADGAGFDLVPCLADHACHAGACVEMVCDPAAPPTCEGGQKKVCNSLGTDWTLIPCPSGGGCQDGVCITVEPNVILIVDTSASMNYADDAGGTLDACEDATCAPWAWPSCDDPSVPQTRLGKAKLALQSIVTSEAAAAVRMALQRFPQQLDLFQMLNPEKSAPSCGGAPLWGLDKWTADNTEVHTNHAIASESMSSASLSTIYPVAFGPESGGAAEILTWVDFEHIYAETGVPCETLFDCENPKTGKACIEGSCGLEESPELRAMGNTPIGRALFYAGEMLRHRVVVQGRACAADADCESPHYTCVDGTCHDPLRACRPNVIVLLSDGGETLDTWPDKFWHPRVQAKRFHYGLGCTTDEDCLNGATCGSGVCQLPDDIELPSGVCHLTSVECTDNTPCFEDYKYPCGPSQTCSGECEDLGTAYVDSVGQDLLRDPAGNPISATVHVIDAAGAQTGNGLIAKLGGGQHVPVDLDDVEGLIEAFVPLLDIKSNLEGCL